MNLAIWIQGTNPTGTKNKFMEELIPILMAHDVKKHSNHIFSHGSQVIQIGTVPEFIGQSLLEYCRADMRGCPISSNPSGTELHREELKQIADKHAVPFQLTSLLADHFAAIFPIRDTIPNLVNKALIPRWPEEARPTVKTPIADPEEQAKQAASCRATPDISASVPTQLPSIDEGLIFPRDAEYMEFLRRNLEKAIDSLGERKEVFATKLARFENLRLIAKNYGRTDRELIESIVAYSHIRTLTPEKMVESVTASLQANAIDAAAKLKEDEDATTYRAGLRYTARKGLNLIADLLHDRADISPSLSEMILKVIGRSTLPEHDAMRSDVSL